MNRMKVFDLCREADHRFEGWFASEAEYERQIAESLVECPFCGSRSLRKMLSAPRLNLSHSQAERTPVDPAAHPSQMAREQIQAMWMQMARRIIETTEDVGPRFAEEARKIHYREAEDRAIRGTASADETAALADEGIEVLALPLPAALKGPVQ
jgi:hypothetical protein